MMLMHTPCKVSVFGIWLLVLIHSPCFGAVAEWLLQMALPSSCTGCPLPSPMDCHTVYTFSACEPLIATTTVHSTIFTILVHYQPSFFKFTIHMSRCVKPFQLSHSFLKPLPHTVCMHTTSLATYTLSQLHLRLLSTTHSSLYCRTAICHHFFLSSIKSYQPCSWTPTVLPSIFFIWVSPPSPCQSSVLCVSIFVKERDTN